MINLSLLKSLTVELPRPDGLAVLNTANAYNPDIIRQIHANFPRAVSQVAAFSSQFSGGSPLQVAERVWSFVRSRVQYKKDPEGSQLIRFPSRFISDGEGDCKSYSLFIASILYNLGFSVCFRYASYDPSSRVPSHVYVVASGPDGKKIIVDGVFSRFNDEKPPEFYKDYKMNVYSLSGVDGIGRRKKGGKKKRKFGFFKGVKKLALAVPRRSLRTLVAVNFHGLASKLAKVSTVNPAGLKRLWEKLGGKYPALLQSINKGKKRKRILGLEGLEGEAFLGAAPAFAAILAAATPIIVALSSLIKKSKADGEGGGGSSVEDIIQKGKDIVSAAGGDVGVATSDPSNPEGSAVPVDTEGGKDDNPGGFSVKPIFLIGAAGLLFLLMNKSKR